MITTDEDDTQRQTLKGIKVEIKSDDLIKRNDDLDLPYPDSKPEQKDILQQDVANDDFPISGNDVQADRRTGEASEYDMTPCIDRECDQATGIYKNTDNGSFSSLFFGDIDSPREQDISDVGLSFLWRRVAGDGRCLFRSIVCALKLRLELSQFEENTTKFEQFLYEDEEEQDRCNNEEAEIDHVYAHTPKDGHKNYAELSNEHFANLEGSIAEDFLEKKENEKYNNRAEMEKREDDSCIILRVLDRSEGITKLNQILKEEITPSENNDEKPCMIQITENKLGVGEGRRMSLNWDEELNNADTYEERHYHPFLKRPETSINWYDNMPTLRDAEWQEDRPIDPRETERIPSPAPELELEGEELGREGKFKNFSLPNEQEEKECKLLECLDNQGKKADELRRMAIELMNEHQDLFECFCVLEKNFFEYLVEMSDPGTFGGEPELIAISKLFQLPICIYKQINETELYCINTYGVKYPSEPIRLLFSDKCAHYDALIPL